MDHFPAWPDYLMALLFGILIPFISGVRSAQTLQQAPPELDTASKRKFYLGNSFFLLLLAGIVLLVWLLYRRPLATLGFRSARETAFHLHAIFTALFVFLYLFDSIYSFFQHKQETDGLETELQAAFMPTKPADLPAYFVMCLAAGIGEEIVYRGFMIGFFTTLFKGLSMAPTLAILVPSLLFSLAHFYQGWQAVFKILVLSFLFGMIFWYTGSLLTVIILHFGVDLLSGILSMIAARKKNF